ncbi:hypothetical protein [uncultured Flavobacterium sp.]|uniref:hypothetical protein n=1 Tax=uncultured Flavobacterium sp. TaxID=165435 RepID=UPI0030821C2B
MNLSETYIFTYIAEFRGGTYCTQVSAINIETSILKWFERINNEKEEIKYLGLKTLEDLKQQININDNSPIPLKGLKNIWFLSLRTKSGQFSINIIKTSNH